MAKIIHHPCAHNCHRELEEDFGLAENYPAGTQAECSCGALYASSRDPRGNPYWSLLP